MSLVNILFNGASFQFDGSAFQSIAKEKETSRSSIAQRVKNRERPEMKAPAAKRARVAAESLGSRSNPSPASLNPSRVVNMDGRAPLPLRVDVDVQIGARLLASFGSTPSPALPAAALPEIRVAVVSPQAEQEKRFLTDELGRALQRAATAEKELKVSRHETVKAKNKFSKLHGIIHEEAQKAEAIAKKAKAEANAAQSQVVLAQRETAHARAETAVVRQEAEAARRRVQEASILVSDCKDQLLADKEEIADLQTKIADLQTDVHNFKNLATGLWSALVKSKMDLLIREVLQSPAE